MFVLDSSNYICNAAEIKKKNLNKILKSQNTGFLFRSEFFFRTTQELEYFFLSYLTLGYMTKTLNQIFFFPSPKSEYFFQQHWESEYFFRKKP